MVLPLSEVEFGEEIEILDAAELPTRTYKIDFRRGRCAGMVDQLEAMEQAIYKRLHTLRFEHLIYSDDYGFESLIGKDEIFVRAELPRRTRETLLQDERITSIENFNLEFELDETYVSFTAVTIYGDVQVLREVIQFV